MTDAGEFDFDVVPDTDQSFENALSKARAGDRLTVDDGIELITTGTDVEGIDPGGRNSSSRPPTAAAPRWSATR